MRSAARLDPTVVVAAVAAVIAVVAWIAFLFLPMSPLSIAAGITCFGAGLVAGFVGARVPAIRGFFVAFRNHDFFWTFATRAFVMMGIYTIYPFLALYFRQVIRVHNPETLAGYWGLAVLAGGILPAIIGGHLSDRFGKRKLFVYASGALQAAVRASRASRTSPASPTSMAFGPPRRSGSRSTWTTRVSGRNSGMPP